MKDIIKQVVSYMPEVTKPLFDLLYQYKFPHNIITNTLFTPYYKCLPAYCKLHNIKNVLEIGTDSGAGSLALSLFSHVDTYDITDKAIHDFKFIDERDIKFRLLDSPEDCLYIPFKNYDFIFVDIDHEGFMEKRLHNKILESGYKGLVVYDDVAFNDNMRDFWFKIEQEKELVFWNRFQQGLVNVIN